MLKLSIMILFLLMTNKLNLYIPLITTTLLLTFIKLTSPSMFINSIMFLDHTSMTLILLTLFTIILIMVSSMNIPNIFTLTNTITLILIFTFMFNNTFMFYIMFELSLIPTFILISKYGKQPERLQASMYLFIYMLLASLPLLIGIIYSSYSYNFTFMITNCNKLNFIMLFMLAFLTKLPMYFTHLWLPKAHVEAPLEGSMILAAILLKLGGYGIIRFIPFFIHKIYKINSTLISISMLGAILASMSCMRQKDLKALVAYSSVAHMALVLSSLLTLNSHGLQGALLMMVAHGLISSSLFLMVDTMYTKYHSRTISIMKGLISIFPNITMWWFICLMINMSAPPTINTLSEILMMSSILSWNPINILMMTLASMTLSSFSVIIYISMNHNSHNSLHLLNTPSKQYLSLFMHTSPTILLLFKSHILM